MQIITSLNDMNILYTVMAITAPFCKTFSLENTGDAMVVSGETYNWVRLDCAIEIVESLRANLPKNYNNDFNISFVDSAGNVELSIKNGDL